MAADRAGARREPRAEARSCLCTARSLRGLRTRVYRQGDRVSFEGLPYQARWYTQGNQPLERLPADPGTPWQPLFKFPGEPTAVSTRGRWTH